jgi:hypothetical protein
MCDYSLGGLPTRLAVEGEELMVHRFPTYSMGLAPAGDLQATGSAPSAHQSLWQRIKSLFALTPFSSCVPAVCIPPGASLILKNIPEDLQRKWNLAQEESVLFTQVGAEANTYRDAVCFGNGRQVLLQHLTERLLVKVVSLGGEGISDREPAIAERPLRS